MLFSYRPHTKYREGNVFRVSVLLLTGGGGSSTNFTWGGEGGLQPTSPGGGRGGGGGLQPTSPGGGGGRRG